MENLEEKEKKNYEIAVLLKEEEAVKDVTRVFSQHNVRIREEGAVKKILLAYPVAKATQAYFGFFYVQALPADIKQLEKDMRGMSFVLRSLIINIDDIKTIRDEGIKTRRPFSRRSATAESVPPRKTLSNEAIEKKIEEILQ